MTAIVTQGPPADDIEIVEAVLKGDREAFGVLAARYESLIAGVAWRYGIRREEIEDVVSEVLLKVYRKLDHYRADHPFSTWLYRLAANHVVDLGRRTRKERARTEMPAQIPDLSPGPANGLEARERATIVREAMAEIDDRYREAIFLVYVEGKRVEEAARILEVPVGTVKTRLMRGRTALRRILIARFPGQFGEA